jgi:hypothetical protein
MPSLCSRAAPRVPQVLHYGLKEKYGAHMDTFFDSRHIGPENGLQRIATALMFLNEPEEGCGGAGRCALAVQCSRQCRCCVADGRQPARTGEARSAASGAAARRARALMRRRPPARIQ